MLIETPIEQLRQPHPDQQRIDAEAARLLMATANHRAVIVPAQEPRRPNNQRLEARPPT